MQIRKCRNKGTIMLSARLFSASLLLAVAVCNPASAENGRHGAFIGGAAAGVVGGVLLNQALQNNSQPQRVYEEPG
jgi:hypothetical protein